MDNLHSDILANILSRLSIEAALHGERVCTTWRAILSSKTDKTGYLIAFSGEVEFDGNHVKGQLFYGDEYDYYDPLEINYYCNSYTTLTKIEHGRFIPEFMVGSCNGLVCFGKDNKDAPRIYPFLSCNLLTGESVFLPEYNYSELPRDISSAGLPYPNLVSGFGYRLSTNNYRVMTIYYHEEEGRGHVQIYTVGGIYAYGKLYWLHQDTYAQECVVVAFDLEGEKFNYIPLPRSGDFSCKVHASNLLKLLGGNNKLYLVHNNNYRYSCIDIWVYERYNKSTGTSSSYAMKECNLKQNYSSRWLKEFSIHKPLYRSKPFSITRKNEVLLWCHDTTLCCYDPKTSTLNKLWDDEANGTNCAYIDTIPHTLSVVSLKALGETNVTSLKDFGQERKAKSGAENALEKTITTRGARRKKKP
ncbi:F-box/kelch-repeat protein At3g06240-like [Papaver somniferum]|uniref:F-box/kelch-repeat protein At3g06240-like n=1 Tax=Papaver somniferum TaxID=3469 RepID=UPI000E6F696E|nr:F-box/kelch-repeat protein At3g06240-like [Papaver somniferum]